MDVDFDPAKDVANVKNHGLSLAEAKAFDLDAATVIVDDRVEYGEFAIAPSAVSTASVTASCSP